MRIKDLPSGSPTALDNLAIDNGTSVRKAPFSAFETGNNQVTFTSGDDEEPNSYISVNEVQSGMLKDVFNKISTMCQNVRYLYGLIGNIDVGSTITGAINTIKDKIGTSSMGTTATTVTGAIYELRQMLTQNALISAIPGLLSRGGVADLDAITGEGIYTYSSTASNIPPVQAGGVFIMIKYSNTYRVQIAIANSASQYVTTPPRIFIRRSFGDSSWSNWFEIATTAV